MPSDDRQRKGCWLPPCILTDPRLNSVNVPIYFISITSSIVICHSFLTGLPNMCMLLSCFSHVQLFVTLWTVACQAPVSMGFSRHEYRSGCHVLLQGISSRPRDQTQVSFVSCIGRWILYLGIWETTPSQVYLCLYPNHIGQQDANPIMSPPLAFQCLNSWSFCIS